VREETYRVLAQLQELDRLAAEITNYLHITLDDLSRVLVDMQELLELVEREERQPSRFDVSGIRESLQHCLRRPNHPMDRIGVATALDYLMDSPYWMEWWGYDSRGNLEFVSHSLNPQQDAFYDYTNRSWFSVPQTSGTTAIIGPYVDFGGINSYSYTVTISMPIITARGFAGVAGADILAGQFERFLFTVERDREPVVLVNADLRVIASTTSGHLPGDLLQAYDLTSWSRLELARDLFPHGRSWQLLSPTA
jgi:hypothetical protein